MGKKHGGRWRGRGRGRVGGGCTVGMAAGGRARGRGAEATRVYRRSEKERPARAEGVHHAREEGIRFRMLTNPVEVLADERGWVRGLRCVEMELGEPDESGRRSPVKSGEQFTIPCDMVISAVGEQVDADLMAANGIEMERKGPAFETNVPGVYCAGDTHRGPATVV